MDANSAVGTHARPEQAANLAARCIARVQNATDAVGGLTRKRRSAVRITIERSTPRKQLEDVFRSFTRQHVHRNGITKAITGSDGVLRVQVW